MKKITGVLFLLIVLTGLLSEMYINGIREKSEDSYEQWELQCMKEYAAAQDYFVFVDVPQHKMYVYKGDELVKEYQVSTGTNDTPSPVGTWKIISKSEWGEGLGGKWMGLDVPWGKYHILGTLDPGSVGWNSSQGSIRMYNKEVNELSAFIGYGAKVEVYGGALGPFGNGLRTLAPGDCGSDVMEVQQRLQKRGYFQGEANGIYDGVMEAAVARFQKDNRLTADKRIGGKMYDLLGIIPFE